MKTQIEILNKIYELNKKADEIIYNAKATKKGIEAAKILLAKTNVLWWVLGEKKEL